MTAYALPGLAVYTVVAHAVGGVILWRLRRRVDRLEAIFRSMGVQFGEDADDGSIG